MTVVWNPMVVKRHVRYKCDVNDQTEFNLGAHEKSAATKGHHYESRDTSAVPRSMQNGKHI